MNVLTRWRWWMVVSITAALILTVLPLAAEAGETETFRFQPYPLEVQGQERRSFAMNLETGDSVTDSVQLTNKSDEVRRFRIYPADAYLDAEGRATVAGFQEPRRGVGSWIDVQEGAEEIALLPGTSEVVRFSVTRPRDRSVEGTGAIVAEEIRSEDPSAGIDVTFRLAILVRLAGDPTGLELAGPTVQLPLRMVPSTGRANVDLTNHSVEPVDASVQLTIESLTGREWQLAPVEVTLEPGASSDVVQEWTTVPRWGGAFRVRASATWEAGTVTTDGTRTLHPPLWLLALAILAVGMRGLRELRDRRNGRDRTASETAPDPDEGSVRRAASDLDAWIGQHRDDPTVEELVGS